MLSPAAVSNWGLLTKNIFFSVAEGMNCGTYVADCAKMKHPSTSAVTQMGIPGISSVLYDTSKFTWRATLNPDKAPQGKISSVYK